MGGLKRRKSLKRLAARQKVYDEHGKNPVRNNPSNSSGAGHDMHRPGSNRK